MHLTQTSTMEAFMKKLFKKEALLGACLYTVLWLILFVIGHRSGANPMSWEAISSAEFAVFFAYLVGYRDANR